MFQNDKMADLLDSYEKVRFVTGMLFLLFLCTLSDRSIIKYCATLKYGYTIQNCVVSKSPKLVHVVRFGSGSFSISISFVISEEFY